MITYQDFLKMRGDGFGAVRAVVEDHMGSEWYRVALDADLYDRQKNRTICEYVKTIMTATGASVVDRISANNKITSNFFARLNTQRCAYSLGNGITFPDPETKQKLGGDFDTVLYAAAYSALIHGVSFLFYNVDSVICFPVTSFAPLYNEETGEIGAGVRFWRIGNDHPMYYELYDADGVTRWRESGTDAECVASMTPYRTHYSVSAARGMQITGSSGYGRVPVVPLYGSRLRQSTLIGMQQAIDSYDLIRSGFANDLSDCTQIYWLIKNAGGMSEEDLNRFRHRLLRHVASVNAEDGGDVQAHTVEIPYEARCRYLSDLRNGIYEDFGALDVHAMRSGNLTATEIRAAYEPLDEAADDFEMQIISAVRGILSLAGVTDDTAVPIFKRARISDMEAQANIVLAEAEYLDARTVLEKLPNITPDEVEKILQRRADEDLLRYSGEVTSAGSNSQ